VSDRHFGIGSDGVIIIHHSKIADFRMQMFNADGSEGEMCGNGIRCVGKYVYDRGFAKKTDLSIETKAGTKFLKLQLKAGKVDSVRVDMGEPILEGQRIPVKISRDEIIDETIKIDNKEFRFTAVSMGNPHAVIFADKITDEAVLGFGPKIEKDPLFPKKTNVEFIRMISRDKLEMRVWERGSGETLACGTGACAALVAAVLTKRANRKATVSLLGGDLEIEWAKDNHVYMTGNAVEVFEGSIGI